ncbi:MAG: hypothetical protein ACR2L2_13330 [Acidobacteriota bacterium]
MNRSDRTGVIKQAAPKRPGSMAWRLSFVIDFAERKFLATTNKEWAELKDDLWQFLAGDGLSAIQFWADKTTDLDLLEIQILQGKTRLLLRQVPKNRVEEGSTVQTPQIVIGELSYILVPSTRRLLAHPSGRPVGSGSSVWVSGRLSDAFLVTLLFLLSNEESTDRIMRCLECGRIFLRVRRQEFCTAKCADRANKRRWRSQRRNRLMEARAAQLRYAHRRPRKKKKMVAPVKRARSRR